MQIQSCPVDDSVVMFKNIKGTEMLDDKTELKT